MNVLISGVNGTIGAALAVRLERDGHTITGLSRSGATARRPMVVWAPDRGELSSDLRGCDAVVHLAGENVGARRWTVKQKALIRDSRVQGTRLLTERLAELDRPPQTLVCASAIGYYGDRGSEELTEDSPPGAGFLPDVCREWEAAALPATGAGIRLVRTRIGVVLSPQGGALAKMLTPFRLGLGGVIGNGKQYMSWIALDDVVEVIAQAVTDDNLNGAVNAVSPNPVTNYEFTKTLGRVLKRPTVLPLPAFAARIAFGQMGEELLLSSTRVAPRELKAVGFTFRYPMLEEALRGLLGR